MPGATKEDCRMNFSLFTRGQLSESYINATKKQRTAANFAGRIL